MSLSTHCEFWWPVSNQPFPFASALHVRLSGSNFSVLGCLIFKSQASDTLQSYELVAVSWHTASLLPISLSFLLTLEQALSEAPFSCFCCAPVSLWVILKQLHRKAIIIESSLWRREDVPASSDYRSPFPTYGNIRYINCCSADGTKRCVITITDAPSTQAHQVD